MQSTNAFRKLFPFQQSSYISHIPRDPPSLDICRLLSESPIKMSSCNDDPLPIQVQELMSRMMKSSHGPILLGSLSERPIEDQTRILLVNFNHIPPRCAVHIPVFCYQVSQELVGRVRPLWDAQCRQLIVDSLNELMAQVNAFDDRVNEVEATKTHYSDQVECDTIGLLRLQAQIIKEQIPKDFDAALHELGLLTPEPLAAEIAAHNIKFRRDLVSLEASRKTSFSNDYLWFKASLREVKPTGPSRLRDDLAQRMLTAMLREWNGTITRLRNQLELMKSILDRIEWEEISAEDEYEPVDKMAVQFEAVILSSDSGL